MMVERINVSVHSITKSVGPQRNLVTCHTVNCLAWIISEATTSFSAVKENKYKNQKQWVSFACNNSQKELAYYCICVSLKYSFSKVNHTLKT